MKIHINKKDIIWNYLGVFATLIINILILPLLIKFLNQSEVGLWYTFVSFGGLTSLFDFGFASTLARNITYCISGVKNLNAKGITNSSNTNEINYTLLEKVLGSCKLIYGIIAGIALFIMIGIGLPYFSHLTNNMVNNSYLLAWVVYAIAIFLNLFFCYYTSAIRGVGDIYHYNQAVVISRFVQIIIAVGLLFMGYGILGLAFSYFAYSLSFRILSVIIIKRNYPYLLNAKIDKQSCKETFQTVWYNAWRDGIVSISNYFTTYAMTIVCSTFLSLSQSGIYSVSFQIVNGIATLSTVLFNTYQPEMQSDFASQYLSRLKMTYSKSMMLYTICYIVILIGILLFGIPILHYIKPDYEINKVFLAVFAIDYFFIQYHILNASFISNSNHIPYVKGFIVSSVANILLIILFLSFSDFGIWVIPIVQLFVQSIYNNWKWPLFSYKLLHLSFKESIYLGIKGIQELLHFRKP